MTAEHESKSSDLDEILAGFLQRVEAGESVDRETLLRQHPELADELQEFLADDSQWKRVARADDSEASPTIDVTPRDVSDVEIAPTFDSEAPAGAPRVAPQRVGYFGDYELLDEIARGGMGVVYKARQANLDRVVALKMILSGQLASEDDVRRFYQEAEAAANLQHTGIVPVFEVGEHEGQHFFSMGYIDGPSLAQLLSDGPLPPREAAQLVRQIAEAIAYAHSRGVIHRDLKPANILLARHDERQAGSSKSAITIASTPEHPDRAGLYESKVTDFGLAKRTEGATELTGTGQILGTPSYMPPEQASGHAKEIGPAADVYSLGAILYCALTGHPPFQAANPMDTLMQVLKNEPPTPRQLNPQTPRDLETVCLKCLQKESAKRYESAQALADELGRWLDGVPIQARPVGAAERGWRWCKRNPVVSSLAAGLAVVLLLGAIVSAAFAWRAEVNRQTAENRAEELETANNQLEQRRLELQAKTEAIEQANQELKEKQDAIENANQQLRGKTEDLENANQQLQDKSGELASANQQLQAKTKQLEEEVQRANREEHLANVRLYGSQISAAQREWESGYVNAAWQNLESSRPDLRGWEYDYLRRLFTRHTTLEGHKLMVKSVDVSSDGKRIVSASGDKTLKIWDAQTGKLIRTLEGHTDWINSVAFSPDGRRIVSGSRDKTVRIWDAQIGEEPLVLEGHEERVNEVAFSPDGQRIVSAAGVFIRPGRLKIWDAQTGDEIMTLSGHEGAVRSVAFSPDGRRIVSGGTKQSLMIWDAQSGERLDTWKGHSAGCVAFSPDGKRIVSSGGDKTLRIWDAQAGEVKLALRGHRYSVNSVAFSLDGKRIVSAAGTPAQPGSIKVWDAGTGDELFTLIGHRRSVESVAFSSDGKWIVSGSADATLKIWKAEPNEAALTLDDHTGIVTCVAFSPDGKQFVSGSEDKSLIFWDVESGRQVYTLKSGVSIQAVAFSPDGKRIVTGDRDTRRLRMWDARKRRDTLPLFYARHKEGISTVAFSPDGKHIVSASEDGTLKIWDAQSGKEIRTIEASSTFAMGVAFSPDGKRFVSGGENVRPTIWDLQTGKQILALEADEGAVICVAFSPDGERIASGGYTQEGPALRVWDAKTGKQTLLLEGHAGPVFSVAYTPDGSRIVSAGFDRTIKIWDSQTGQQTLTLKGHTEPISNIAISPDGKRIVSAGFDKTIKIWNASPVDEAQTPDEKTD